MDTAYFYLTGEGKALAERLCASHPGDLYGKENFKENLRTAFGRYESLVCIMATGIVVRILAPLIDHKTSDPAVVVLDQRGRHAISLLSGHLGGANDLAREMAFLSGGEPVITTATDVAGELSFDTFAKKYDMAIENIGELKHISSALLEGGQVRVVTDYHFPELGSADVPQEARQTALPDAAHATDSQTADASGAADDRAEGDSGAADSQTKEASGAKSAKKMDVLSISEYQAVYLSLAPLPTVVIDEGFTLPPEVRADAPALYLRPRSICAGVGCKRNMAQAPIEEALLSVLREEGLSPLSLRCIATIPLKADEPGILETARRLRVPLAVIPTEEIEKLDVTALGIAPSDFVAKQTGVLSVSTASSYLASGRGEILRDKVKFKGITIALSRMRPPWKPARN